MKFRQEEGGKKQKKCGVVIASEKDPCPYLPEEGVEKGDGCFSRTGDEWASGK